MMGASSAPTRRHASCGLPLRKRGPLSVDICGFLLRRTASVAADGRCGQPTGKIRRASRRCGRVSRSFRASNCYREDPHIGSILVGGPSPRRGWTGQLSSNGLDRQVLGVFPVHGRWPGSLAAKPRAIELAGVNLCGECCADDWLLRKDSMGIIPGGWKATTRTKTIRRSSIQTSSRPTPRARRFLCRQSLTRIDHGHRQAVRKIGRLLPAAL
jgi:hypothetical protein